MKDSEVIDAFVAHLREHGYPELVVDQRPDEENRTTSDIDAVAGPFAIEHTSVDTIENQRRDSDWFMRAAGGLEQELTSRPPFRLNITLKYDAVGTGQDWGAIRGGLKQWVATGASALGDGRHVVEDVPGVPFELHVNKDSNRRPGVYFARWKPEDEGLPERVREQVERKAEKLAPYREGGKTTVLLIENDDIALMNEWKMLEAIRQACPNGLPAAVDQLWYADTSIPSEVEFRDFTPEL